MDQKFLGGKKNNKQTKNRSPDILDPIERVYSSDGELGVGIEKKNQM